MNFRTRDLQNFLEIAYCRTMREGAEKLQISQPALSESIKRLEKDVGEIVFYRARSGIALTPAGQEIEYKARIAFNALNDIATGIKSENKRFVTIGCHETIGSYFLPPFFKSLSDDNQLSFRLKHGLSREIQLDIQQGRIDVGVVVNPVSSPDLVIRTIATDEVCVWQSDSIKEENVRVFCDLGLNQTHGILKKWNKKSYEVVETKSLELIARIVSQGIGYGIIPKRLVNLLGLKKIFKVPGAPIYKDQFALVYRPEFGKNPQEKMLLEELRRAFEPFK